MVFLQISVWSATLRTSEKNYQCKKPYTMIPVLLSEQSLSLALAVNWSAYTLL
jgi:hypothetical protein